MKKRFLLVDGNYLMFASFYASYSVQGAKNLMHSPLGVTTNGVHVFLMTLSKLISYVQPQYIFVAFDSRKKTKRHELYSDYKAGRAKAPEIIFEQFALIKDILKALNISYLEKEGDEADDLIATLASNKDTQNFIYSKDKDLLQLVNENTCVLKNNRNNFETVFSEINLTNFLDYYGIEPKQIADFKGLSGDSSDNLKGVAGIGEKGAIKLLREYSSLENIYQNIDKIKGKTYEKLVNDKENAFFCKKLAKLNLNVDISKDLADYAFNLNYEEGQKILDKHGLLSAKFRILGLH